MPTTKTIGLYPYPDAATLLDLPEAQLRSTAAGLGFSGRCLSVSELTRIWVLLKPWCICFRPHERKAERQDGATAQEFILAHGGILTPQMAQLRFASRAEAAAFIARVGDRIPGTDLALEALELGPAWHMQILADGSTGSDDV